MSYEWVQVEPGTARIYLASDPADDRCEGVDCGRLMWRYGRARTAIGVFCGDHCARIAWRAFAEEAAADRSLQRKPNSQNRRTA